MDKRKFKIGDRITNGIVTKTVLAIKDDHYLTDVGMVEYINEDNWEKI